MAQVGDLVSLVRIDDRFPDHPKVQALSNEAECLHVAAMCHCVKYLTDGLIAEATARSLAAPILEKLRHRIADISPLFDVSNIPAPGDLFRELITVKTWRRTKTGFEIHDFGKHQRLRADVEAGLEAQRSGQEAGGKARSAGARRDEKGRLLPNDLPAFPGSPPALGKQANGKAEAGSAGLQQAPSLFLSLSDSPSSSPTLVPSPTGYGSRSTEEVGGALHKMKLPPCAGPAFEIAGKHTEPWKATVEFIADLKRLYPDVDVTREMDKAASKIRNGAVTKKTAKGMPRFLHTWMEKQQNRTHGGNGAETKDPDPTPAGQVRKHVRSLAELEK